MSSDPFSKTLKCFLYKLVLRVIVKIIVMYIYIDMIYFLEKAKRALITVTSGH